MAIVIIHANGMVGWVSGLDVGCVSFTGDASGILSGDGEDTATGSDTGGVVVAICTGDVMTNFPETPLISME